MDSPLQSENAPSSTPSLVKQPGTIGEILRFAVIALVIVIPIRFFVAQPFIVSGASMQPTFENGQYLIVDQLSYRFHPPQHGDVIVFKYPKDPSKYFIKRVIGIPGDTVSINGSVITIFNKGHENGVQLAEPYVAKMTPNGAETEVLGTDEYFVMGDNRDNSSDSRVWGILPKDFIVGRAYVRLFPFQNVGYLPGSATPITN